METSTLLPDYSTPPTLVRAGQGRRLANLLIDTLAVFTMGATLGVLAALAGFNSFLEAVDNPLLDRLLGIILTLAYYLLMEGLLGRTFGKMLTGTRVVNEDGTQPSFGTIFKRTMWRVVPFDTFTFLGDGYGWHDSRSETLVVRT